MRNQQAVKSLEQLVQAAIHLQETWDEIVEEDYPLSFPYNELVDDLLYWLVAVRLKEQE